MESFMTKDEMETIVKKKVHAADPNPAPINTGLPPFNTTLNFYNAFTEERVAEIELIIKRITFARQNMITLYEWSELDKKKQDLRKLFINSNRVIKENQASLARFNEKIREHLAHKITLDQELTEMKCKIQEGKDLIVKMERYVNEYSVYEKFLESIATVSPEFHSVGDVLNRYEVLEHARKDCAKLLEEELDSASDMRREMLNLIEEKSTIMKELSNKLIMLQVHHKQARERRIYWSNTVTRIKNVLMTKEEERLALWGGCWDLYNEMCTRRGVPASAHRQDMKAQLAFIQKTILFYKDVNTIAMSARQGHSYLKGDPRKTIMAKYSKTF